MKQFKFTIPGRAVPLMRPRINIGLVKRWRPGRAVGPLVYTPSKCTKWQKFVANTVKQTFVNTIFSYPIAVSVVFFIKRPGTASKFAHRPDIDNYTKNLLDALDGVLWEDDAFVTHLTAMKSYVNSKVAEATEVVITQLKE